MLPAYSCIQEAHLRSAIETYFDGTHEVPPSKTLVQASLPLSQPDAFLAMDIRMLVRQHASAQVSSVLALTLEVPTCHNAELAGGL